MNPLQRQTMKRLALTIGILFLSLLLAACGAVPAPPLCLRRGHRSRRPSVCTFEGPHGRTTSEGKFLQVWKKVDGKWKGAAVGIG